jgi:hypothetical protein
MRTAKAGEETGMQLALYEVFEGDSPRETGRAATAGQANTSAKASRAAGAKRQQAAPAAARRHAVPGRTLCAACREREARYGFRDRRDDDPTVDRPKTLCFDCFRMEMDRRRAVAEQLARGWNATQGELPLAGKLEEADRRRRRAQIAARRALGVR